jgi:predicted naringenin-chalcone synthase
MASRQKTKEVFIELINLQLKPHGKTYKDVVKENDWYMKYNTTREKEALFIKEATKILKTKLRMSKAVAEKEISWFILQWGLTTNAENYSDETTLVKSKYKNTRKKSK